MGLPWETSGVAFAVLTCLLGGAAAYMAGRGLALTWQPLLRLVLYMLVMGAGLRFLHFALFDGTLLSLHYYAVDTAILIAAAGLGYRLTRVRQMATRYRWLYRRSSPLTWSER